MNRAGERLEAAVLAGLALLLRSIRLMKKPTTDDTAQPALQRAPEETGATRAGRQLTHSAGLRPTAII